MYEKAELNFFFFPRSQEACGDYGSVWLTDETGMKQLSSFKSFSIGLH